MTARAFLGHVVFLVAALAFAWVQANRVEEKKGGPSSTVLLDTKKGDVAKVVYTWPKGHSTVESKGKEAARAVVVNLSRELEPKKPDKPKNPHDPKATDDAADAGPETAPPATPQREEAKFPGGKSVVTSLEAFEPLKTRRTLGEVDAARLKAMGLEKPEQSIVITTASGKTLELEVGESSFGGQGRYARVKGQSAVHLLDPSSVSGLEGGMDSLMEKRIVAANVDDVLGYSARYGDREGAFVHQDREQSSKRKFVPKDDPNGASNPPGKLMTTLRNLRATKLADAKSAGAAVATVVVEIEGRDKQKVDVLEKTDGEGHLVATDGWVFEISETQSKELLDDLAAVFP